jgi:hypothetical protein
MLLSEISQSGLVQNLLARRFDAIPAPKSVQDAVERGVPLVMVSKATGDESLLLAIEFEILTTAGRLNLNAALTIKPGQSQVAAQAIFDNFRTESLEDIKLAFSRGSSGLYGEIYRLDGAVLVRWIQCYLEEKYAVIEQNQAKKKLHYRKEESDVDYRAHIERMKQERQADEEKKQQAIEARKREAALEAERLIAPRKVFDCDGIQVRAVSEKYARMAYKQEFGKEPEVCNDCGEEFEKIKRE